MWLADEVAEPDDRSASAKLTTRLQTLHSRKLHARRTPRVSLVQAFLARKKHIAQVHAGKRSGKSSLAQANSRTSKFSHKHTRASRFSHKQKIAQVSRRQISRRPRESRSSSPDLFHDGLHIPYDSCQLFTGPTFKKQKDIILDLTMHTDGTIGVDLLAHTALRCHVSVMLLCFLLFKGSCS